jgi:hypothetical protein
MDVRFRPISTWPGQRTPPGRQKNGDKVFSAGYKRTLDSLDRELRHLKARDVVIEADLNEDQIRLDGWPRGDAYPRTSGVVLSFTSEHGPLRIPCDYFKRYEHNLRAISLHLERLRLAQNYGVGEHGEQYRGWKQIEAPGADGKLTVDSAATFVAVQAWGDKNADTLRDDILRSVGTYRGAYREAAGKLHPDVGGRPELWQLLQEAKALLDAHHGKAATP